MHFACIAAFHPKWDERPLLVVVTESSSALYATGSTLYYRPAGAASAQAPRLRELSEILLRVQHELFNLGSILSTLPADVHPKQARITEAECGQLEREIDGLLREVLA